MRFAALFGLTYFQFCSFLAHFAHMSIRGQNPNLHQRNLLLTSAKSSLTESRSRTEPKNFITTTCIAESISYTTIVPTTASNKRNLNSALDLGTSNFCRLDHIQQALNQDLDTPDCHFMRAEMAPNFQVYYQPHWQDLPQ